MSNTMNKLTLRLGIAFASLTIISMGFLFTLPAESLDRVQVNTDQAQTLSNKTLASPIINTPTVTGGTFASPILTTPAITGNFTQTSSVAPTFSINTTAAGNRTSILLFSKNGSPEWLVGSDFPVANVREFAIWDGTAGVRLLIDANGVLDIRQGKIKFPATQVASTDVNTLDDYEEGTWTPTVSFSTPGDVSVTYGVRLGRYRKIGKQVTLDLVIKTTAFTHTTASGSLVISGLPAFTAVSQSDFEFIGMVRPRSSTSIVMAGKTQFHLSLLNGGTTMNILGSAQAADEAFMTTAHHATGTEFWITGQMTYEASQ